ncbi:hypothetical protein [Rickettsiella endosymbiont of Dermanyssus gallinae]|uniref:hypothetical protein n=1 Tax=Rickettsiella endosymbiont of Dermanyssus gallinae TaxID=2856608 RepID=UPI001C5310AF|nr:hypothetical protein [Rickettsiella endosymbiont of Dermanyssus gallinae]
MNKNPLAQLRQKGITIQVIPFEQTFKLIINPPHLINDKTKEWLIKHQSRLYDFLKKEQYLKKLIENVGRHDNWTSEEIEEMFDFAINQIGLDVAISSYQITARAQSRIVSLGGYNKTAFCKTCQKHILLDKKSPYEVPHCPYCERNKESTNA